MGSIYLFSIVLVNREISFKHTVLGFALDSCCSEYSLICKSLKYSLSHANHISVLEIGSVRFSMTFKSGMSSKIKSLAPGSTTASNAVYTKACSLC